MNLVMYLEEPGASKAHFLCKSRTVWNHTWCNLGSLNIHYKSHSKRLEILQEHHILAPLSMDKIVEWCNSFGILPKPNGMIHLCLYPELLSQVFIRLVHRGPTINDILPILTNTCYMTLIDANSGYHNLKPDKKSSYLTTLHVNLKGTESFRVVPVGNMFQQKIILRSSKTYQMF